VNSKAMDASKSVWCYSTSESKKCDWPYVRRPEIQLDLCPRQLSPQKITEIIMMARLTSINTVQII